MNPSIVRTLLLLVSGVLLAGLAPARAGLILVDFGADGSSNFINGQPDQRTAGNWNNYSGPGTAGDALNNLIDNGTGLGTGINMTIGGTGFQPITPSYPENTFTVTGGYTTPGGVFYPGTATEDDYFYNTGTAGSSPNLVISGLDPSKIYTFTFYGSRASSDNRTTLYTVTNTNNSALFGTVQQNAGAASPVSASVGGVTGTTSATINMSLVTPSSNTFGYIAVLEIDYVSAPEPSTVALAMIGGLGLFFVVLRRRKLARI